MKIEAEAHIEIIKIAISYTLLFAFVVVVILTLLSLSGVRILKEPSVRNKLYWILVIQLAAVCFAAFRGLLKVDPKEVVETVKQPYVEDQKELEQQVRSLKEDKNKIIEDKRAEMERLKNEVIVFNNAIAAHKKRIKSLQDSLEEKNIELARMVTERKELSVALAQIGDIKDVERKVAMLERSKRDLHKRLEEKEAVNAHLATKLNEANNRLKAMQK